MKIFEFVNIKDFMKAILIALIIPNIVLWLTVIFFQPPIIRPIFNIDYLLPLILFAIPRRPIKIIAIILFVIIFLIDMLAVTLQCLPYEMAALNFFFLAQDLMKGPSTYRNLFYLVLFVGSIELILFCKLAKKTNVKSYLVLLILLAIIWPIFPRVSNSQIPYIFSSIIKSLSVTQDVLSLHPAKYKSISEPWHTALKNGQPLNYRVLFILAESWGYSNDVIFEEELKVLKSRSDRFEYFKQGTGESKEGTVIAELNELCNASFKDIRFLSIVRKGDGFDKCLPNLFSAVGYNTVSLEGSPTMYAQTHWYPLAGFKKMLNANNIGLPKNSIGGSAVADLDLIPVVAKAFKDKNQKLFYYWITYTTHQPFPAEEIKNDRFSCEKFNVTPGIDACRNLILTTQFMDAVADLVTMPEMDGVEVLIVGDHRPLFVFNYTENAKFFDMNKISWIHFKIKDGNSINKEDTKN